MPNARSELPPRIPAPARPPRRVPPVAALLVAIASLGFDTSRHGIPLDEILAGGPPKDGIPAITEPRFVTPDAASFLQPHDRVIAVEHDGVARAYPLRILTWHEVVNDVIAGTPVAITYCPLTDSAVVYDRTINGQVASFGVSGRLYQSNVLLYDHQTESLWSQLKEAAVTGPRTGTRLHVVPSVVTTWADWRDQHPGTAVLSQETGFPRDYERDPYDDYRASPDTMFPVTYVDTRLPPKERVLAVRAGTASKAYPLARLAASPRVEDTLGGRRVRIEYDLAADRASAKDATSGKPLSATVVYWFAWAAFHPETAVWEGESHIRSATPPTTGRPPTGMAEGSDSVAIVDHSAYWTALFGMGMAGGGDGGKADGAGLLVIRGSLRNTSGRLLDHVTLVFDLLDARGHVVTAESGYNRSGEGLRPIDSPVLVVPRRTTPVTPIGSDGSDTFRMVFLRNEIPPFDSYRVRVKEAVPVGTP